MKCIGAIISGIIASIIGAASAADSVINLLSFLTPEAVVSLGAIGGILGAITLTTACDDYLGGE